MFYRRRELRRLWDIEIYEGDPEDPDVTTRHETVVAWNAVDAIRHAGARAAKQPTALHFVTWADGDEEHIYRIESTAKGPIGDPIVPTLDREDPIAEDWT